MKPSAWGLFGVSGGFWFFETFFPRFFPPRFGESLGTFWAKKSFRENPTSNGFVFFVYCLPQEKRTSLFFGHQIPEDLKHVVIFSPEI